MRRKFGLRRRGGGGGGGVLPSEEEVGVAVLTLITGQARSLTSTRAPPPAPQPPPLSLLVRSPSNTHKHTVVRAAVWVLVVACGPVLFELPLRLPSVQIHYERSSAPPASTACDSSRAQKGARTSANPPNPRTDLKAGRSRTQWPERPTPNQRSSDLSQKFWESGFS